MRCAVSRGEGGGAAKFWRWLGGTSAGVDSVAAAPSSGERSRRCFCCCVGKWGVIRRCADFTLLRAVLSLAATASGIADNMIPLASPLVL